MAIENQTRPAIYYLRKYAWKMSEKHQKNLSIKGKITPFFFAMLFVILCATSIFLIHPVLYFLKYFAAFGLIIGILLIVYILKTDEL